MTNQESDVEGGEIGGRGTACRAPDPYATEIWPEPSPEEREAIGLALCHLANRAEGQTRPRCLPWAEAGKREALDARMANPRGGGRGGAGRLSTW
jgi:hypothetical protein